MKSYSTYFGLLNVTRRHLTVMTVRNTFSEVNNVTTVILEVPISMRRLIRFLIAMSRIGNMKGNFTRKPCDLMSLRLSKTGRCVNA